MALTLNHTREPINHGDIAVWFNYMMQQARRGGEGGLSMELYNNAGALWLSQGFAGINDGVVRGSIECTVAGAISLVGLTVDTWAAVEAAVSGTAVTISITSIAGETDGSRIPAAVKAAYDYSKQGYYLVAAKRLIGIAFIKAAGTLGRIVNCEHGKFGFKNIVTIDYVNISGVLTYKYIASCIIDIGPWNMRAAAGGTGSKTVSVPFKNITLRIRVCTASIYVDGASTAGLPLEGVNNAVDPNLIYGGVLSFGTDEIYLRRRDGSPFDSASYDDAVQNRGTVYIEWES